MLFSSSDSKNPFNLALIIKYFYHFGLVKPSGSDVRNPFNLT